MGNCQAIEAAALVIQHPCGKIERLYWSISASEVMRLNPGHYVSLIIPLPNITHNNNNNNNIEEDDHDNSNNSQQPKTVRFTRVKLLRPTDTLALGHAYRLVTTQEVMKVLRAKKYAKAKRSQQVVSDDINIAENIDYDHYHHNHNSSNNNNNNCDYHGNKPQSAKSDGRQRGSSGANNGGGVTRSKSWRPSLKSISEFGN